MYFFDIDLYDIAKNIPCIWWPLLCYSPPNVTDATAVPMHEKFSKGIAVKRSPISLFDSCVGCLPAKHFKAREVIDY